MPDTKDAFDAVLALEGRDVPAAEWRAAVRAFAVAHDVQPPVRIAEIHGEPAKRRLLAILIGKVGDGVAVADEGCVTAALGALRIVAREQACDDELRGAAFVLAVGRLAGLSDTGPPNGEWDELSASASWLLVNLLVIGGHAAATPLCTDLGAEVRIEQAVAKPAESTLLQTLLYANIAFHLSLQAVPRPRGALPGGGVEALSATLRWAIDEINAALDAFSGRLDGDRPSQMLKLVGDVVRTLFNVVRQTSTTAEQNTRLLGCVKQLLSCDGDSPELREAKLTSLQLSMVMPKEVAFAALAELWPRLTGLLLPLLQGVEAKKIEPERPVLLCVVLQHIAEHDASIAQQMRAAVFTKGKDPTEDPLGANPNRELPDDAPLEDHLKKLHCSSNYVLCAPRLHTPSSPRGARPAHAPGAMHACAQQARGGRARVRHVRI